MLMAREKNWIIIVGGRSIHDIAKDLAEAGLKDIQTLQEIGSITGSADDETVSRLRKVRGVKEISPDITVNIGPPGSRETW
jgi:hypothetical protein